MIRYLFLGSPQIAAGILEDLCNDYHPPIAVVTQPARKSGRGHQVTPTPVEQLARDKKIDVFPTEDINTPEMVETFKKLEPDLIFVVAFGQILKKEILDLPKLYSLNVHASLLPKYRGAAPVQWALLNGDAETGISIQRIVKELDAGDVFVQEALPIEPTDTTATLWVKMEHLGSKLSVEAIRLAEEGKGSFTPQDPDKVTFAPKIKKEQAKIDWTQPAQTVVNQVRAFLPWPVAETQLGDQSLKIFQAEVGPETSLKAGEIQTDQTDSLAVACGDGRLLTLTEIQLQNRKRLEIADFLRAYQGRFPFKKMGPEG